MWKTWQALQQDYWWPTMKAFVKEYVKGCAVCQQNKTITKRNQPPLQPIGPEEKPLPFATMSVDFVVKLPLSKGSDSILTITDQGCTKAVILVPCREDMGAEAIAELFKERVFPYTGIPTRLISDLLRPQLDVGGKFSDYYTTWTLRTRSYWDHLLDGRY